MSGENLKKGKHENKFSQLVRFWRREGKKYCAIALCASLIAGNIGHMAAAASEDPDYKFELTRQELNDALQEAIANANVVQDGELSFAGAEADTYQISLAADGCLYELTPEIEENDGDLQLRIFVHLDNTELINDLVLEEENAEAEEADEIADVHQDDSTGEEQVFFLLTNCSDEVKTAVIRVDHKETDWIMVEPHSMVEMPEPEGEAGGQGVVGQLSDADPSEQESGVSDVVISGGDSSETNTGPGSSGGSGSSVGSSSGGSSEKPEDGSVSKSEGAPDMDLTVPETNVSEQETETMESEASTDEKPENPAEGSDVPDGSQESENDDSEMDEPENEDPAEDESFADTPMEDTTEGDSISGGNQEEGKPEDGKPETGDTGLNDSEATDTENDMTEGGASSEEGAEAGQSDRTDIESDDRDVDNTDSDSADAKDSDSENTEDYGNSEAGAAEASKNSADSSEDADDSVDTSDEPDDSADSLSAAVSFHKTYRVASSKVTPSNATPSDATPSDALKESLDGTIYGAVRMGSDSAVALVTTLNEIGITIDGHFSECEDDCSGADCVCGCHEVAHGFIRQLDDMLAEAKTYTEQTETDTFWTMYDKLMGYEPGFLSYEVEAAYDRGELTDPESVYVNEVYAEKGTEILGIMQGLGFDPYAVSTLELSTKEFTDVFYWRLDAAEDAHGIGARNAAADKNPNNKFNELAEHVHVYFKAGENSAEQGLNYGGISDDLRTLTLKNDFDTVYKTKNMYNLGKPATEEIHIVTDEGYVITGYRICCEFAEGNESMNHYDMYGEDCLTVAINDMNVDINEDGKYYSDFTIYGSTYQEMADDSANYKTVSFFGHQSETYRYGGPGGNEWDIPGVGAKEHHYVLLLEVAEVNVNIHVDKEADRESVKPGENIKYTATATTDNDLTNPEFQDDYLQKVVDNVNDSNDKLVVKLLNNGTEKILTQVNNDSQIKEATSTSPLPGKYYFDKENGKIYLDGLWKSTAKLQIIYDYPTATDVSGVLTNTVTVKGTKTGTDSSVEDIGVAKVDVIVNEKTKGTLRVYKTFEGLSPEEVIGQNGVLEKFKITIGSNKLDTPIILDRDDLNYYTGGEGVDYIYYDDIYNLVPGDYTVKEENYGINGYTKITSTYTVRVGENGAEQPGNGTSTNVEVKAGETSFVKFNNNYNKSTSIIIQKQIAGNMADRSKSFAFTVSGDNGYSEYFTLKGGESITLDNLPIGTVLTIQENKDGYKLDSVKQGTKIFDTNEIVSDSKNPDLVSVSVTLKETNEMVIFTNCKNEIIDTGILLDSMPYVLILGAVAAGIAFYFIRKKKDDEDDLD